MQFMIVYYQQHDDYRLGYATAFTNLHFVESAGVDHRNGEQGGKGVRHMLVIVSLLELHPTRKGRRKVKK